MNKHKLGVVVPYRDREEQLSNFLNKVPRYLQNQGIDYEIIVVEQMDLGSFNRGALLNFGVNEAKKLGCDYLAFHDVDLLPREVDYSFTEVPVELVGKIVDSTYKEPFRIKVEELTDDYFGGVVLFPLDLFTKINGFSNRYIGWGFEDNDLLERCKECLIPLSSKRYRQVYQLQPSFYFNGKSSCGLIKTGQISLEKPVTFLTTFNISTVDFDPTKIGDECCVFSIPGYDLALAYTNYGTYKFEVFDNYRDVYSIHTKKLPINYPCQACITVDPGKRMVRFYLNGAKVGSFRYQRDRKLKTFSNKVYLGVRDPERKGSENYLNGQIAEFAIFNQTLTQREVGELYSTSYIGLGRWSPTYWISAQVTDAAVTRVPNLGSVKGVEALFTGCTVEPLVRSEEMYLLTVPTKRAGVFECQPHETNGIVEDGYYKSLDARKNQQRFRNVCSFGTYRLTDGLSTLHLIGKATSTREINHTRVKVYFNRSLPK